MGAAFGLYDAARVRNDSDMPARSTVPLFIGLVSLAWGLTAMVRRQARVRPFRTVQGREAVLYGLFFVIGGLYFLAVFAGLPI